MMRMFASRGGAFRARPRPARPRPEGARGLHRPAGRDHLDRPALPQPLAQQQPAAAHLRAADQARREPEARARARDVVEGARRPHLGIQAAQEREVPRRLALHRRRRGVHATSACPTCPTAPRRSRPSPSPSSTSKVVDPHTIVFKTAAPHVLLPSDLASVLHRLQGCIGEKATTDDYNSGKAAIGTGPYKFVEYVPNQRVVLKANYGYWGGEEPWDKVTFKILSNSAARVAALLSGDVQMIETVPTSDIAKLSAGQEVRARRQGLQPRDLRAPEPVERQDRRPSSPPRTASRSTRTRSRTRACARRCRWRSTATPSPTASWRRRPCPRRSCCRTSSTARARSSSPRSTTPRARRSCSPRPGYPNGFAMTIHGTEQPLHQRRQDRPGDRAVLLARRHRRQGRDDARRACTSRAPPRASSATCCSAGARNRASRARACARCWPRTTRPRAWASPTAARYSNPAFDKQLDRRARDHGREEARGDDPARGRDGDERHRR